MPSEIRWRLKYALAMLAVCFLSLTAQIAYVVAT